MTYSRSFIDDLIYGHGSARRYMQSSPMLYDVWSGFAENPWDRQDLLMRPYRGTKPGELCQKLRKALDEDRLIHASAKGLDLQKESDDIAYNQADVAASLSFPEAVRVVLPMTGWWEEQVHRKLSQGGAWSVAGSDPLTVILTKEKARVIKALETFRKGCLQQHPDLTPDIVWLIQMIGSLAILRRRTKVNTVPKPPKSSYSPVMVVNAVMDLMSDLVVYDGEAASLKPRIHLVNCNREAETCIDRSTMAIKSDAALRLFEIKCSRIRWAIVDSGVDASHPAFREKGNEKPWPKATRVGESYDFSFIRHLLSPSQLHEKNELLPQRLRDALAASRTARKANVNANSDQVDTLMDEFEELKRALQRGRDLDWGLLKPFLAIPYDEAYQPPVNDHGTHVAGILAAGGDAANRKGVCPDINLIDIRVLDEEGKGNEFNVIAALQFIRYLNGSEDHMVIHGANLSLSINHDVANYACGRTPVCDEADRLSASGVCVVSAAGNKGYIKYQTAEGPREGYQTISITDPGNAEKVITVGATHRYRPHTYGVSYFSSRGPTGDGRLKPDLVAPGEKIEAPTPNGEWRVKDGTSMAAPHVSGAAALLMARHREMVGQPEEIKKILCETATDLGRERYFQGHGMLDILRALQSV